MKTSKSGFGLVEALASMVILALMFTAVMMLNYSNHQAAMRIATRNEAMQIGHRVIDSLQAEGLSAIDTGTRVLDIAGDTSRTTAAAFRHAFRCSLIVSNVGSVEGFGAGIPTADIIRAKKIDVYVKWTLSNHTNTINLNTVVE